MSSLKRFNTSLYRMLQDLTSVLPDVTEIVVAENLCQTMLSVQPETALFLDGFWDIAKDHEEAIVREDDEAMLATLRALIPNHRLIDRVWSELNGENRRTVLDYIKVLYEEAKEFKTSTSDAGVGSVAEGSENTLYLIYNNVWKEFLQLLEASIEMDDERISDASSKLQRLLQSKGPSSDVVYQLFKDMLGRCVPEEVSEETILQLAMPPVNPTEELERDQSILEGVLLPLNRCLSMPVFLEQIMISPQIQQLTLYWHYLKMMTHTLSRCPESVVQMMSHLAQHVIPGQAAVALV